jgi:hypothetical protein
MTRALTAEGTIVGTFHYMPPEQVEGHEADARSDIFAFGAMLYEMLTGRRAFAGDTGASVIAAILASEPPPIADQRPTTPPALDRLVRTCLAKDPDERWQTAHDVMLQLRGMLEGGSTASGAIAAPVRRLRRDHLAWSVAAVALLAAIGLGVAQKRSAVSSSPVVQFGIETPQNTSLYPFDTKGIALSPDGTRIAFVAEDPRSGTSLYIRDLATTQTRALAGTEDASYPFWSPDGTQLGFFANQKLHRINLNGGPIVTLCEAASGRGGSWNREGVIVFTPTIASRLYRISAGGGRPEVATPLEADGIRVRWPWFLPDGNRFLYIATSDLVVGSLDGQAAESDSEQRVERRVCAARSHCLFTRHGADVAALRSRRAFAQRRRRSASLRQRVLSQCEGAQHRERVTQRHARVPSRHRQRGSPRVGRRARARGRRTRRP